MTCDSSLRAAAVADLPVTPRLRYRNSAVGQCIPAVWLTIALGEFYLQDPSANGVATRLIGARLAAGITGTCIVLITSDAERSASAELDATALHEQDIESSEVYYMEGYLAASPTGLQAALQGRQIARGAGIMLATTLSDVSMINFCREGLAAMVGERLDYLFCNEGEAQAWCGTLDPTVVYREISQLARTVCLTLGPQGCILLGAISKHSCRVKK
jgi:sugar/nucleoside kinase (ribokinase family)